MYAKPAIAEYMQGIDFDAKQAEWRWLNALYCAVSDEAKLNDHQSGLLRTIIGEAQCGMRKQADGRIPDDVFAVATWINSCR